MATSKTIKYTERMVGEGHPSLADTLNRLTLVSHNTDGSHKGYVEASQYSTAPNTHDGLQQAILTVPSTTQIVVTDIQTITGGTVINNPLEIKPGGMIYVASGTVTINGSFSAGLYQCFSGAGSIVFGTRSVTEVYPEWWGAIGDGMADDTSAVQKAATSSAKVLTGSKSYAVTNVSITNALHIIEISLVGLNGTATLQAPLNITANDVTVERCLVTQKANKYNASSNLPALYANGVSNLKILNSTFIGGDSNGTDDFGGVHLNNCTHAQIIGNHVKQTKFEGVCLVSCTGCTVSGNTFLDCTNSGVATMNGTRHSIIGNTVNYVDTANYLGATGLSINSTYTSVTGNTINNPYLHGIVLGHTSGARTNLCADYSVVSGNTILSYGRNLGTNGGITIDNALYSEVVSNTIGPSINNTGSSQYNIGIQFTNTTANSVICEVCNNTIDTAYGHGISAPSLPDASASVPSVLLISGNIIKSSSLSGISLSKGYTIKILNNQIINSNRSNNVNGMGIYYTYSTTDPTELTITGNTILDVTPYQKYGVYLASMSATSFVSMYNNVIRGWFTKPYSDTTAAILESKGNDYTGAARSGSGAPTTSSTSTTITTGQVYLKEQVIVQQGNVNAITMGFYVGTVTGGTSFVVGHTTAVASSSFLWKVL